MPKQTRKLLVYLDQNFLSAMAKADGDEEINPAFTEIYRLLHQGFVDEKLVVPSSVLHDIESSLATHLKDRIATYQGYLGQVRSCGVLRRYGTVRPRWGSPGFQDGPLETRSTRNLRSSTTRTSACSVTG